MKRLVGAILAAISVSAFAQPSTTTTTTVVNNVTTTIVETVTIEEASMEPAKVAVFVQNRTRVPGMDDEVDGVRDRLAGALAEIESFEIMDSAQVADTFRRYKVTVDEEKTGLIPGIFTGGSVPRVAQMLGCDYIVAATIVDARGMKRKAAGRPMTNYTLRMTLKVMDSTGASVGSAPVPALTFPVLDGDDGDAMGYYQILFDRWVAQVTPILAKKAPTWRRREAPAALAAFTVTTTIDSVVGELESQTRGVNGELLQELRKVVGGATIELDGAVIGSAPGQFQASPGLHQLKVSRDWMKPYTATVNIYNGMKLNIALEMNDEGIRKWGSMEQLRANVAQQYAEAAWRRGIKVNLDTQNWHDVGTDTNRSLMINNINQQ
ncbi:MAG: PEGA domain-containing protein [Kiritimatiellae bacterium]|nr:PEGA domain-containing protein [Kiritimatiellia bacterium]